MTALTLCFDTSHRTSSVDKPQYTRAYLSLKGGFSGVLFGTELLQKLTVKPIKHFVFIFLQLLFFDVCVVAILDQHVSHDGFVSISCQSF